MQRASKKSDWVRIVEAVSAKTPADHDWARDVSDAAAAAFPSALTVGLGGFMHDPACTKIETLFSVGELGTRFLTDRQMVLDGLTPASFRSLFYPPSPATTIREVADVVAPAFRDVLHRYLLKYDCADAIGLLPNPMPGVVLALSATTGSKIPMSGSRRRLFTQIALHIESGYRLRKQPESVLAVVSSSGKILHRTPEAPSTAKLTQHVTRIERARKERNLDLWTTLVDGRGGVIERLEGTKREWVVLENSAAGQPIRALSASEVDAVSYASRGFSSKATAYALGVSAATISARLESAARKVGLATRMELVRIAAMLTRDPRARFAKTTLTTAEHHVLELLEQGLSNREIAAIRNRSVRTIANQVASLLRKTTSTSRRDLATRA